MINDGKVTLFNKEPIATAGEVLFEEISLWKQSIFQMETFNKFNPPDILVDYEL